MGLYLRVYLWFEVDIVILSETHPDLPVTGAPLNPEMTLSFNLLQVYLLILSVTTLSLLLAPVLWRAAITKCVPRPDRRASL